MPTQLPTIPKYRYGDGSLTSLWYRGFNSEFPVTQIAYADPDRKNLFLSWFHELTNAGTILFGDSRGSQGSIQYGANKPSFSHPLKIIDTQTPWLATQEIWFASDQAGFPGIDYAVFAVYCGCQCVEHCQRMKYIYDNRLTTVSVTNNNTKLVGSNNNRVAVIFSAGSSNGGANDILILSTGEASKPNFAFITPSSQLVMPYRDWGPLVRSEFWANWSLGTLGKVSVTEVIAIPQFDNQ